jgi:hypothetical protein
MLLSQGLELLRSSKPKQTDTTQRWKFELRAEGLGLPLHTRVEFSRRGSALAYALEPVRADIVRAYGLAAPTANHYTADAALRQKIEALASRAEPQARDVWDLEHLLRTADARHGPVAPGEQKTLERALDRVLTIPFSVYKAQVLPYLSAENQELFGTPQAWARITELVVDRLSELPS